MVAEVVSIGTELLLGQIVDTDAAYLAQQLSALGIAVYFRATVGDNAGRAAFALRQALSRADLVITIGGLGPTMDDITREVIAEVTGSPLKRDEAVATHLRLYFAKRGYTMVDSNLRQADVPEGAIPIFNANGTAPGLLLEKDGKTVIALPGPPNELIPMCECEILPRLQDLTRHEPQVIRSRTLRVVGVGESQAEEMVKDLMTDANPSVAPYAKVDEVHLRVTSRAATAEEADALNAGRVALLRERLGEAVYGEDGTTLEAAAVALLKAKGKTVATAESCTGGLLSGRLTAVPGSSAVFRTGIVSYANETKARLLNVPEALLAEFGAVSAEVAEAMAAGARTLDNADYGISITGIAGPDGGTDEKPVGLVYIGLADGDGISVEKRLFGGIREDVRRRSTQAALNLLRQALLREEKP